MARGGGQVSHRSLPGSDQRRPPEVVENPLSAERITILYRDGGSDAGALVWELEPAPGKQVPSSHMHPHQQERFTVLEGELEFRLGWPAASRARTVGDGTYGRVHHFANRGRVSARVQVETVPALDMAGLLRTAAALARDQHQAGKSFPRLTDLVLFMREFESEVSSRGPRRRRRTHSTTCPSTPSTGSYFVSLAPTVPGSRRRSRS
jgi:uncharacterized cupin superfamily protein